jgi:arylsulfatase A-like enzyme
MYDELISYIDRKLSDFFDFLKGIDRYDEAMILVMSDHGEGFGEEEVFNYTDGVYSHQWDADPIDSLVRVPLVVKYPNMEHGGACFTHPVQNGDLLATLADRFDWEVDVPELTQPFTEPESRTVVSKSNAALRVTTETGYVIQRQGDRKVIGEVGDDAFDVLEDATLPSVETVSGDIPGIDEREREQLEERLEYLGYK